MILKLTWLDGATAVRAKCSCGSTLTPFSRTTAILSLLKRRRGMLLRQAAETAPYVVDSRVRLTRCSHCIEAAMSESGCIEPRALPIKQRLPAVTSCQHETSAIQFFGMTVFIKGSWASLFLRRILIILPRLLCPLSNL
jgi:hypothetical protein